MDEMATHIPVLATMISKTTGPILELGIGEYSTPLIHMLAGPNRMVVSIDDKDEYADSYNEFINDKHTFKATGYDFNFNEVRERWALVFIDSTNGTRVQAFNSCKDNADFFIFHDTQPESAAILGLTEILDSFKYKLDYKRWNAWTSVCSFEHPIPL